MIQQLLALEQTPKRRKQWEIIAELLEKREQTLMDLQWLMTIAGIYASETGISARIRELAHGKKPGWTVTKRTENGRTYFYRMIRTPELR